MIGQSFADDIDSANFFDHIDDFLDFPTDELDDLAFTTNAAAFPPIWSTDSLPSAAVAAVHDDVFSGNSDHSVLSAALSVPYEDIVQLEWLSNFVDDSFAGAGNLTVNTSTVSPSNQFQTSSPVSVLESSSSSSSCSGEKQAGVGAGKCGRARSKRPRPPSFIPRPPKKITSPTNSGGNVSSDSENHADSCSAPPTPPAKKPKKIKLTFRRDQNGAFGSQGVRKCLHCEITKTPQWRAGPLGPKTLCNACGVRFKSGRLFPEYRPAASPTFVPCFHSNSHKKVLEMRTKQGENAAEESPELIPNTNSGIVLGFV